jgi:hypothetical protein
MVSLKELLSKLISVNTLLLQYFYILKYIRWSLYLIRSNQKGFFSIFTQNKSLGMYISSKNAMNSYLNGLRPAPPQHVEGGRQEAGPGQVGSGQSPLHHRADHLVQHSVEGELATRAPDPDGPGQQFHHQGGPHACQHVLPEAGCGGSLCQFGLQGGDGFLQNPNSSPQPDVLRNQVLKEQYT